MDKTNHQRSSLGGTLLTLALLAATAVPAEGASPSWKLAWSDEFDGNKIDRTKWDFDLGNGFFSKDSNAWIGGWGNNELQCYTDRPENAFVTNGMLHLRAAKEKHRGFDYTSARLKTRKRDGSPLFNQTYGRFEFRARLPAGQGIWPALWMLPQEEKYGTWAASGEIDIMEARGQEPDKVNGTLHYGGRWPANTHSGKEYRFPANGSIADFHLYAVEWEPGKIRWYVDNHLYATQSFWWSGSQEESVNLNEWPAPFDRPFYLILNVAVGGQFLGNPDESTPFPAEMQVDYVRVYEKPGGYGPPPARGKGHLPSNNP